MPCYWAKGRFKSEVPLHLKETTTSSTQILQDDFLNCKNSLIFKKAFVFVQNEFITHKTHVVIMCNSLNKPLSSEHYTVGKQPNKTLL